MTTKTRRAGKPRKQFKAGYHDGSGPEVLTFRDHFYCTTFMDPESEPNEGSNEYMECLDRAKLIAGLLNAHAKRTRRKA